MGLFGDTLRDARRPLAGTWVRRATDGAPEPDAALDEMPDTGMQTVFRFQKGAAPGMNPAAAHEASPGPAAGKPAVPAADPLPAGAEMGTPEPSAMDVIGDEGISDFLEVNRTSELETGQVRHGSPGRMAAANAKSESGASRSEVLSGRLETALYREPHKSLIPEGSERSVSDNGKTSGSRPAGRGASPSETHPTAATHAAAHPASIEGEAPAALPPSPLAGEGLGVRGDTRIAASVPAPSSTPAIPHPSAARGEGMGRVTSHSAQPGTDSAPLPPVLPRPRDPAPPALVIGRIDVVVVADAPARPQPNPRPDTGYLSRHYLKRL